MLHNGTEVSNRSFRWKKLLEEDGRRSVVAMAVFGHEDDVALTKKKQKTFMILTNKFKALEILFYVFVCFFRVVFYVPRQG